MRKMFIVTMLFALVLGLVASPAFAALDLTGVTLDTAPIFTVAGLVIAAYAAIWAIRKVYSHMKA